MEPWRVEVLINSYAPFGCRMTLTSHSCIRNCDDMSDYGSMEIEAGLRRLRQQPTPRGGLGGEAPPVKKSKLFFGCSNLGGGLPRLGRKM